MVKSEFNRFRKDYKTHNKYVVESICDYAKNTFYDQLMMEADIVTKTAIDPSAAFRMLRDELKAKLSQMIQELRATISGSMTADRDTEAGAGPSGGGGSTGAGPSGGGGGPSGTGAGPSGPGAGPSGTGPSGGGGGPTGPSAGPSGAPMAGGARPTVGSAWNDMKTALRPKDGWLKGLGRVVGRPFRDIGRYIKKNWYDENHSLIESLLMEQNEQIVAMIDKFEKDILAWFDQRSAEIARDAGIDLAAAGIPSPVVPKGANPATVNPAPADLNGEQGFRPVGTQAQKQNSGTDEKVITGGAGELLRSAKEGDPVAKQIVITHLQNVKKACEILGVKTNRQKEWKDGVTPRISIGNMELDLTKAKDYKVKFGRKNQEEGKAIGTSSSAMVKEIAKRIYVSMGGDADRPDLSSTAKTPAKDPIVIKVWDTLPGGGGNLSSMGYREIIAQLLVRFGSLHTGSAHHAPTMENPAPTGAAPTGAAPTGAAPTGAAPTGAAPTGAAPTGAAPTGAAPVAGERPVSTNTTADQSKKAKIDHAARRTLDVLKVRAEQKKPGAQEIIDKLGHEKIQNIVRKALSSSLNYDPTTEFNDHDNNWKKIIIPALSNAMKAPPEAAPEAPGEVPPEQAAPEAPGEVPPEVPPEVPGEAPGDNMTTDADRKANIRAALSSTDFDSHLKPQGEVPPEAEEIPTEVPGAGPLSSMLRNRKAQVKSPVESPEQALRSYGDKLDSMIKRTDVGEYLVDELMSAWKKLNPTSGDDEFSHLKNQLTQSVDSLDAESAIEGFKKDLLIAKMRQLGLAQPEAVGESYKRKIDRYRKLIKESSMNVAPTKRLREKLGLPA